MTENYETHKNEIDADGNRILMFWDIPQYYESGLQLGFAFQFLIGPISSQVDIQDVPATAKPDFIAGIISEMCDDAFIMPKNIEGCYKAMSPDTLSLEPEYGIAELRKNTFESIIAAFTYFWNFTVNFHTALKSCDIIGLPHDLNRIYYWS